ncbi:hypothetical protein [Mesorhizobium sp.]|uniref:hypothetical protein n=1 Tax=Mesorhizobium sp. TaxID=1871066 RepID=UPI000FE404DE|nr:hypothetical protein [Mesorhizobium sp.]RWJ03479.1 MAG: hypothetical protein EOR24_32380 [Mesorhizobium sp.]
MKWLLIMILIVADQPPRIEQLGPFISKEVCSEAGDNLKESFGITFEQKHQILYQCFQSE